MEKIKQFIESDKGKDAMIVMIVILVGLGSFELGRLSKDNTSSGINIEYPNQEANAISATGTVSRTVLDTNNQTTGKSFFASSRGKKYYSIGCSAGKSIKQENRIYFTTADEAIKAGYELSSSCK